MATARDIITSTLRKIAVLGSGSSLSANDANDALTALNEMIASFSAEGAMIFEEPIEVFNLVGGQTSYSIGASQDFNTVKPLYITAVYVRQGSTDYPLSAVDEVEYSRIAQKDIGGTIPTVYYYDNNFPNANIYLYPTPSGADTIHISSRKPLAEFATLDAVFAMPAQYKSMLVNNLAVEIAADYEKQALPSVQKAAMRTKKTVIAQNERNEKNASVLSGIPSGGADAQQSSGNNILGGYYN